MTAFSFPQRLTLELTARCNLSCVFCPRRSLTAKQGDMDEALFKKAVDEAAERLPVALVPFFRGEPLLHPKAAELVAYAKRKGLGPIQFTTNAALLDETIAKKLIDSRLDFISFSVDAADAESYESVRKGAKFDRLVTNIERFVKLKGDGPPTVQVSAVESDKAPFDKDAFVKRWITLADRVRVYVEHSKDGAFGSLGGDGLPQFEKRLPCRKIATDMVVYWNGEVALCNHDWERKERIGSVAADSIAEIWNGERYARIRRMHEEGNVTDSSCAACDHWKMYYTPDGMIGEVYEKRDFNKCAE